MYLDTCFQFVRQSSSLSKKTWAASKLSSRMEHRSDPIAIFSIDFADIIYNFLELFSPGSSFHFSPSKLSKNTLFPSFVFQYPELYSLSKYALMPIFSARDRKSTRLN